MEDIFSLIEITERRLQLFYDSIMSDFDTSIESDASATNVSSASSNHSGISFSNITVEDYGINVNIDEIYTSSFTTSEEEEEDRSAGSATMSENETFASNAAVPESVNNISVEDTFSTTASIGSSSGGRARDLENDFPDDPLNLRRINRAARHSTGVRMPRSSLMNFRQQRTEQLNFDNSVQIIDVDMPRPIPAAEDEDVIFVSSNVDFIDLCTPTNRRPEPPRRAVRRSMPLTFENMENVSPPKRKVTETKSDETVLPSSQDADIQKHLLCAICLENKLLRQPTATKCGHVFCGECIREALRLTKQCPICRSKQRMQTLLRVHF